MAILLFLIISQWNDVSASEWKIFTPEYSYNNGAVSLSNILPSKNIVDIVRTKDGTIWMASADNYPISISNIKSECTVKVADAMLFAEIKYKPTAYTKLTAMNNGELWMLTPQVICRLKPNALWEGYNTTDIVNNSSIPTLEFDIFGDMALDTKGSLWISGVKGDNTCGFARLEDGKWNYYMLPKAFADSLIGTTTNGDDPQVLSGKNMVYASNPLLALVLKDITFDKNGDIWTAIGNYKDKGLCKFSNGVFTLYNGSNRKLPTDIIIDLSSDVTGNIYVATAKGLLFFDSTGKYLPHELKIAPTEIAFDQDNNLWWSTPFKYENDPLIKRFNPQTKTSFTLTTQNSPLTRNVKQVYIDDDNNKYFIVSSIISGSDGLYILSDDAKNFPGWKFYNSYECGEEIMNQYALKCGFTDESGIFYGVSHFNINRTLNIFKNGAWEYVPFSLSDDKKGLLSEGHVIYCATKNKQGDIYLGTTNSIYKFSKIASPVQGINKEKTSELVKCITTDTEGNIWIGSGKGLAKYDGTQFEYFNKGNSKLPSNWILSLYAGKDNKVWVGTPDGVVCFDKENQLLYDKKSGMDKERAASIAGNSQGKIYIGATNLLGITKNLHFVDNGSVKTEALPSSLILEKIVFDGNDNLWINGRSYLKCQKKNGEYITYDESNSPLLPEYFINNMWVIGKELWLIVETQSASSFSSSQTGSITKESEILEKLKRKFNGIKPVIQTMVLSLE